MERITNGVLTLMWRAVVLLVAVVALAVYPLGGSAVAEPSATRVITAAPVGPNGEPINGYQEAPSEGNVTAVSDCTTPSPAAVGDDIYSCAPSAAGADACWPSTPGSLLCLDNPWDRRLHRVTFGGQLPHVQPAAVTDPLGLVLDDGTRCRLRNGGAWGGRDDGYVGVYYCGAENPNLAVLWLPSQGPGSCVDRSSPLWTIKVGELGAPSTHFPPPETRTVTTAWFVGDSVPA
jgi:hypothetical protein